MTRRATVPRPSESRHVRVITIEQAVAEARDRLDDYERRYGITSDRLHEAFTDASGQLQETGEYLQWTTTWERWRELSARLAT